MAGIKGELAKLSRLSRQIKGLSEAKWRAAAGKAMGATALKLVSDGFRLQHDPQGKPWKQLADKTKSARRTGKRGSKAKRKRAHKILLNTGRLRASFSAKPSSGGFTVSSKAVYAAVHQFGHTFKRGTGTQRVDARPMVPTKKLGKTWELALAKSAKRALEIQVAKGKR